MLLRETLLLFRESGHLIVGAADCHMVLHLKLLELLEEPVVVRLVFQQLIEHSVALFVGHAIPLGIIL